MCVTVIILCCYDILGMKDMSCMKQRLVVSGPWVRCMVPIRGIHNAIQGECRKLKDMTGMLIGFGEFTRRMVNGIHE